MLLDLTAVMGTLGVVGSLSTNKYMVKSVKLLAACVTPQASVQV